VVTGGVLDASSDLYAVGCLAYEMLTGQLPFQGPLMDVVRAHASRSPIPPGRLRADLPERLESIVLKLMAKDQRERYQSADAVLDDMAVLAGAERPVLVSTEPTEAGTLLAEVVARAEPLLGPRLRACLPPQGTLVTVDRERLAQALMNLLQNAAVHARDAPVDLRLVEEPDSHRFEVEDEGAGVPAGHEEAVFEPFHRGGLAGGDGGGLGLALVRTVAEAHGGSAGIDNRPGRGVTFWVRVPR
jgi:signal transduction histidine kinase